MFTAYIMIPTLAFALCTFLGRRAARAWLAEPDGSTAPAPLAVYVVVLTLAGLAIGPGIAALVAVCSIVGAGYGGWLAYDEHHHP
jgi:hypothetical protein